MEKEVIENATQIVCGMGRPTTAELTEKTNITATENKEEVREEMANDVAEFVSGKDLMEFIEPDFKIPVVKRKAMKTSGEQNSKRGCIKKNN